MTDKDHITNAAQPVAWQFRALDGTWLPTDEPHADDLARYGAERFRSLYAAQPPAAPVHQEDACAAAAKEYNAEHFPCSAGNADALRLLAAEDERQSKLHELLETIREQIRLEVAPEHRPEGLFKNIQDAVYAMRGRTRLMDDAAITHAIQSRIADGRTDSPSPAIASPVAPSRDEERGRTFNEPQPSPASAPMMTSGEIFTYLRERMKDQTSASLAVACRALADHLRVLRAVPQTAKVRGYGVEMIDNLSPKDLAEWSDNGNCNAGRTVEQPTLESDESTWPDGCKHPNSCSDHAACMYMHCRHEFRDISGEVKAALALSRPHLARGGE